MFSMDDEITIFKGRNLFGEKVYAFVRDIFNFLFFNLLIAGLIIKLSSLKLDLVSQCGFRPNTAILGLSLRLFL